MTHFAPSILSSLPIYRENADILNTYYASDQEEFIKQHSPVLWLHGHMHNSSDYEIYSTRVVCNPRGYIPYEPNPDFNSNFVVEVP